MKNKTSGQRAEGKIKAALVILNDLGLPQQQQNERSALALLSLLGLIGSSGTGRFLIVAHTDRGDRTRIISARELTRKERKAYEKEIQRRNR